MVENKLFNEKIMEDYIIKYKKEIFPKKDSIQIWIDKLNNDELKDEVKNYSKFTNYILNDLLGYTPEDYIDQESIGDEKRPVDYVLLQNDKKYVAVELKGTSTPDITKRHNRENSAVEQACLYATEQKETKWAIASNYDEFRLFDPKSRNNYISFRFRELTNENILKKFLICFSKFSLIEEDIPQKLLKQSTVLEREFEDEFYQLFSETRLMLIKELENSSEDIDRYESIRLAQLILNRYIFICFAEDLGLLPPLTSTNTIMTPIENANLRKNTIWNRLNELFFFVNEGNPQKGINEFNGGLFAEELDEFKIRDMVDDLSFFDDCYKKWKFEEQYEKIKPLIENYKDTLNPIYKNLLTISEFDFDSQLDVNILGHIFENSIGDIEELKKEDKTRRKKDGVFYTPEYITDHICRNTIIPYLSKSGEVNTVEELISEYNLSTSELEKLDKKLKDIKIIDPACGSGAFLNKAADVLLEIHEHYHAARYVHSKNKLDQWFDSVNSRREILINNIYGVDLNPESVEITKLALFLKVANKGMKLPNLDKNIKCGNSLIDDKDIIGDKAFKWKESFNEIIKEGGFDIVIGNPPYITPSLGKKQKTLTSEEIEFLNNEYESYEYKGNTYVIFIEKGIQILKNGGMLSYITPNTLLTNFYYKKIRNILLDLKINKLIEIKGKVFEDAETGGNLISIITKDKTDNLTNVISFEESEKIVELTNESYKQIDTTSFKQFKDYKFLIDIKKLKLILKLRNSGIKLENKEYFKIYQGIITGNNNKFLSNTQINDNYKKILRGSDIHRYSKKFNSTYILFEKDQLHSNYDEEIFLTNEKIISRQTSDRIVATYDDEKYFSLDSTHVIISKKIDPKIFLGIYNSKLINFYYQTIVPETGKTFPQVKTINLKELPIVDSNNYNDEIISKVEELLDKNNTLTKLKYDFRNWLNIEFNSGEISNRNKLYNFWELDEKIFFNHLKKKIGKINLNDYQIINNTFENTKHNIKKLSNEINTLENNLDQIIYKLYNLTDEEISIIEESLN